MVRIAMAVGMIGLMTTAVSAQAAQAPAGEQRRTASVNTAPRVDVRDMPRPIDMHDSVWIENLTIISSIIATVDTNGIRMPERVKAGKVVINGVPLAPIEKTIANGKRIVQFRTEAAVTAIKKAMKDAGR